MVAVNPYLNFNGNTEEAFKHYKSVFGGDFAMVQRFKETPEAGRFPADASDKIMHIALPIGKGNMLMGTDVIEASGQPSVKQGNNFYITLSVESKEEGDKLFKGLSQGGKVQMEMQDTFWGAYFGMVTDKYGVQWMISYDKNFLAQS
jgi:PhnB protein